MPRPPISGLLVRVREGDPAARGELWRIVYDELHALAQRRIAAEPPGRILQPTALVHEAYLKLAHGNGLNLSNRRVFFAAAAKTMRQILIDDARRRKRLKRGGVAQRVPLDESRPAGGPGGHGDSPSDPTDLLALDEALKKLESIDPQMAEVIDLRFHAGLSREEIAEMLEIAPRTVDKLWSFGRAWLFRQLSRA